MQQSPITKLQKFQLYIHVYYNLSHWTYNIHVSVPCPTEDDNLLFLVSALTQTGPEFFLSSMFWGIVNRYTPAVIHFTYLGDALGLGELRLALAPI